MVTFDQSLFALYSMGRISAQQAIQNADSQTNMTVKMRLSEHHSPAEAPDLTFQQVPDR